MNSTATANDLADVFAVVVNWNGGDHNQACVANLLAEGLAPGQIVFVDNASSDGSVERVVAEFEGVVVIREERNTGFGEGANRGIALALERGARAVVLVNNDVVFEPGTLAALATELERNPKVGIVGPRVLLARQREVVWAAGGSLDHRQNLSTLIGHRAPDGPRYRERRTVDYVAGCAMAVRREVFERIGLLDAAHFAYHEDLDFCISAGRAGFEVVCLGEFAALHDAHHSTGGGYNPRRKYMMGVNSVWFLRKHGNRMAWARFALFDVLSLPPLLVFEALRGRARGVLAKALGTWHGLRGRRVDAEILEPGATALW